MVLSLILFPGLNERISSLSSKILFCQSDKRFFRLFRRKVYTKQSIFLSLTHLNATSLILGAFYLCPFSIALLLCYKLSNYDITSTIIALFCQCISSNYTRSFSNCTQYCLEQYFQARVIPDCYRSRAERSNFHSGVKFRVSVTLRRSARS